MTAQTSLCPHLCFFKIHTWSEIRLLFFLKRILLLTDKVTLAGVGERAHTVSMSWIFPNLEHKNKTTLNLQFTIIHRIKYTGKSCRIVSLCFLDNQTPSVVVASWQPEQSNWLNDTREDSCSTGPCYYYLLLLLLNKFNISVL